MTSYPIFIFGWELDNKGLREIAEQSRLGLHSTNEEASCKEVSRATLGHSEERPLEYIEHYLIEVQRKISSILGVIRLPGKEPIGVKTDPCIIKVHRYNSSSDVSDFGYYLALRIWEPARGELEEGLPGDYLMSPLPWSKKATDDDNDGDGDGDEDVLDKILSLSELDSLIIYRSPYLSHDYYDMDRGYEELAPYDIKPDDIQSNLESKD